MWQDYGKNLGIVLDEVEKIIENTSGKIVVTADHGNAIGELGIYGHPGHVPLPSIKKVPWAVTEGKGKDTYEVLDRDQVDEGINKNADELLEGLGYKI